MKSWTLSNSPARKPNGTRPLEQSVPTGTERRRGWDTQSAFSLFCRYLNRQSDLASCLLKLKQHSFAAWVLRPVSGDLLQALTPLRDLTAGRHRGGGYIYEVTWVTGAKGMDGSWGREPCPAQTPQRPLLAVARVLLGLGTLLEPWASFWCCPHRSAWYLALCTPLSLAVFMFWVSVHVLRATREHKVEAGFCSLQHKDLHPLPPCPSGPPRGRRQGWR